MEQRTSQKSRKGKLAKKLWPGGFLLGFSISWFRNRGRQPRKMLSISGKTLHISRKTLHLEEASPACKYLPQFPIWYQYPLHVLGAALGDATTQLLPAVVGEGRGKVWVNFRTLAPLAWDHGPQLPLCPRWKMSHRLAAARRGYVEVKLEKKGVHNSLKTCVVN